ncbi:MAG: LysE family transporter [Lachnospiraceae bacterium]|nr:LysE family transporter [Lachnospiraceae bacterium]
MSLSVFWEMTLTACITVWSPGPNNIFLLSSASRYGIRRNLPFMLGVWTGSLSLMVLCGIFCSALTTIIPGIQPVMKYVGAAYLLYLAWQTFKRLPPGEGQADQVPTYPMGILLQLVNVKIIIYGLTMFSSFILPHETRPFFLLCFAFYLMVLGGSGKSNLGPCRQCVKAALYRPLPADEYRDGPSGGMVCAAGGRDLIIRSA